MRAQVTGPAAGGGKCNNTGFGSEKCTLEKTALMNLQQHALNDSQAS